MNLREIEKPKSEKHSVNFYLFSLILLLTGIGFATLFSTSYYISASETGEPFRIFLNQAIYLGIALFFGFVIYKFVSFDFLYKSGTFLMVAATVACFITRYVGEKYNGGYRWIDFGLFTVQPSEIAKFALIVFLARVYKKQQENAKFNEGKPSFLKPLGFLVILCFSISAQNDLSTTILIFAIGFVILVVTSKRILEPVFTFLLGLFLGGIYVLTNPNKLARIQSYLNPNEDLSGGNYQIGKSLKAIKAGGLFGVGVGNSSTKKTALPEMTSDFIFTIFSEENGLFGVAIVFILFFALVVMGLSISKNVKADSFKYVLALGISITIGFQSIMHFGVVSGCFPNTGVTLPLFSQGGSSLIITICMLSLLLKISQYTEKDGI